MIKNLYPLAHIVCHDKNHVIGDGQNDMPWRCKEDMDVFKQKTMNKIVIMGYNTFKSIPSSYGDESKAILKGRIGIVITDPNRTAYQPVGRVDIDRLIESNLGEGKNELDGFTIKVPNLGTAIEVCDIIHEALAEYKDKLTKWIARKDEVKAFIIGGARIYTETLRDAYIREIHETVLDVYYVPKHLRNDELVSYPQVDETYYRLSTDEFQKCKVVMGNTTLRTSMQVRVWKKRVGLTDLK